MVCLRSGADRNDGDGSGELFLEESDVVLDVLGELVLALHLGHVGFPPGESDVDRFDILLDGEGELGGLHALDSVGHTSLDFVEIVEARRSSSRSAWVTPLSMMA